MSKGKSLKEFLAEKNHHGAFRLAIGHYAELQHGLMGTFPAIESESGEVVMTTDPELLKRVCATLPPRQFKFGTQLIYVNILTGVAYSILGTTELALEKAIPFQTLTQTRFEELIKQKRPFKWAPGLVGNDMTAEEFKETLEVAAAKV
jgi:hypothetical protein